MNLLHSRSTPVLVVAFVLAQKTPTQTAERESRSCEGNKTLALVRPSSIRSDVTVGNWHMVGRSDGWSVGRAIGRVGKPKSMANQMKNQEIRYRYETRQREKNRLNELL